MTDATTLSGETSAQNRSLKDLIRLAEKGLAAHDRRDALHGLAEGLAEGELDRPSDVEARLAGLRPGATDPELQRLSLDAEIEAAKARQGLPSLHPSGGDYDELRHQLRHTGTLVRHAPRSIPAQALDQHYVFDRHGVTVGKGGFARVFLATQRGTDQIVAIKLLRAKALRLMESMPVLKERFRREALVLERAEDAGVPGMVRLVEVGEEGGVPYLVTSFHEGGSLRSLLDKMAYEKGLPLVAAVHWGIGLFATLAHLHAAGFVHRDIKPDNILFDTNPTLKRLDEVAEDSGTTDQLPSVTLADAGAVLMVGEERLHRWGRAPRTEFYAPDEARPAGKKRSTSRPDPSAPEDVLDILPEVGPHTDVYSAASVLLEMIVGSDETDYARRVLDGSLDPNEDDLERMAPFIEIAPLLTSCLNPVAALRKSDAGEVAQQLSAFLGRLVGGDP